MATVAVEPAKPPVRTRQNWIISPGWDLMYFIGTPLLSLAVVVAAYPVVGVPVLTMLFVVYTIAHHLPTFIRVYGDKDLWRRFRWQFIIGPVIPFGFAMLAVAYVIRNELPIERTMYLMFIPTIWDTWHFLMQHYGFVRIYDRSNAAPRRLASRMDLALCATWFTYIMVSAGGWLPNLLMVLNRDAAIPVLYLFTAQTYQVLVNATLAAALGATLVYAGYLAWCWGRGYFISYAKLLLLAITFGTMYVSYVAMEHFVPGWSFWLGFIVIGFVHNTQYFAIVWKYCRSLTRKADPTRPKLFQKLFVRGGAGVVAVYVIVALGYGFFLGGGKELTDWIPWLSGTFFAMGFTSVMMHYYFDGFIWKVRHRENQAHLAMLEGDSDQPREPIASWWDRFRDGDSHQGLKTAAKHVLYFGVPLAVVSGGAWWVHSTGRDNPARPAAVHLAIAQEATRMGRWDEAIDQLHRARAKLDKPLNDQLRLVALRPMASPHKDLSLLIGDQAEVRASLQTFEETLQAVKQAGDGSAGEDRRALRRRQLELYRREMQTFERRRQQHARAQMQKAVDAMQRALASPGPFDESPMKMDPRRQRGEAYELLATWYEALGQDQQAQQTRARAQ